MNIDTAYTSVEAEDQSSWDAVQIFREKYAERKWHRATVDRMDGLVLYEDPSSSTTPIALHFKWCACGYSGGGPIDTKQIIMLSGVTDDSEEMVWDRISRWRRCTFPA